MGLEEDISELYLISLTLCSSLLILSSMSTLCCHLDLCDFWTSEGAKF